MDGGPPLDGWRVLVPRGGPWGEAVAAHLRTYGAEPLVVPLLEIEGPEDVAALQAAFTRLADGAYTWVALTSTVTVDALRSWAGDRDLSTLIGRTQVAAVGPATAQALSEAGVAADLVPRDASARGMVAAWPAPPRPASASPVASAAGTVLAPQSALAGPDLADGLRSAGWQVDAVVAYRPVPAPAPDARIRRAIATGQVDAVLLTSGSVVRTLLELLGRPAERTVLCCIGPRTAEAARDAGLTVSVVAPTPCARDLVAALADRALDIGRPSS